MSASSQSGLRLAAIGIFLGLPALFATITAMNFLQVADDQFTLAEKQMQLSSFMRRLTTPARDGRPVDLSPIYVTGTSAALASANLQQYVVGAIAGAAGKIIETAVVDTAPTDDTEVDDRVGIRASFEIDNDGLLKVLRGIESGVPLLDVDSISVRRLQTGDSSEKLRVDIEVTGHWRAKP